MFWVSYSVPVTPHIYDNRAQLVLGSIPEILVQELLVFTLFRPVVSVFLLGFCATVTGCL